MNVMQIIQFLILQAVFFGVIIFILRRVFLTSTQGAVKRLDSAVEETRAKQTELAQKIKEADEELAKRRKEAEDITKKMMAEAEEKAREEREKIIKKARDEAEEIIAKAQSTKDKVRAEIEKEATLRIITYARDILTTVLSKEAKGVLNKQLIDEFLESLEKIDMNQASIDVDTADIVTIGGVTDEFKNRFAKIIKEKLKREIKINNLTDSSILGGVLLRFGSLALDGSLLSMIQEAEIALKQKAEGD